MLYNLKTNLNNLNFANYLICNLSKYIKILTINNYKNNFKISLKDNSDLLKVIFFFKKHTKFQYSNLADMFGIDLLFLSNNNELKKKRYHIYYNLLSLRYNNRIIIEIAITSDNRILSLSRIFNCAGWLEREILDMYGIYFIDNKDLRRILTDYGFEGYPLRKDFPLTGYIEIRYDDTNKRIVYEPLEISQEFRFFDFKSPWEQIENIYN
jgi:NADH-quinone oxidoreductase subunit C